MTNEQWFMMMRLEHGMEWTWHLDQNADDILRYLISRGLCEAREDFRRNWLQLSQEGKILLQEYRENSAAEKKKLEQWREEMAEKEAEKKVEHRFQLLNTLFGAVVGSLLTLFVEHFSEVLAFFERISQSG